MKSYAMKPAVRAGGVIALLMMLAGGPAFAAQSLNGSTAITFSSNPATLSGDSATDVTITSTTTSTESASVISAGKVVIQLATDGVGNPVPAGSVVTWVDLNAPGQNPDGSGQTSLAVDLDGLGFVPGTVGGFRAHYVTGGNSPHVDTHFSLAVDLVAAAASCSSSGVVNVGAVLASGNGTPNPGDTGPWQFTVTVQNCTGADLTGVKVQGGTSGWTNFTTAVVNSGDWTIKGQPATSKKKSSTQVIVWTVDIPNGVTQNILVTVDGQVSCGATDGQILFISGPWSAAYNGTKSDYTGRVSLTVDGSSKNSSCP